MMSNAGTALSTPQIPTFRGPLLQEEGQREDGGAE